MNHSRLSWGVIGSFGSLGTRRCFHTSRVIHRLPLSPIQRAVLSVPLRTWTAPWQRLNSGLTAGGAKQSAQDAAESEDRWANTPAYEMTFTCKPCSTRSTHKISKQGYHHGTVLISCPG